MPPFRSEPDVATWPPPGKPVGEPAQPSAGPGLARAAVYAMTVTAMLRPGRAAPLVILVLACCRPAGAEDYAVQLSYDVRYGPLSILSMELTSEIDGDRYRATSDLRTEGLIGKIFPWQSTAESRGRREGESLRPEWHHSDGSYRNERRTVQIDYPADGSVRAVVTPGPKKEREVVPAELQQATVDPLTAGMVTARTECRGSVPVFDGRRRYDLRLEELAPATVPRSSGALYAGSARRCRATVEARAGYWRDDPRDSSTPTTLEYWIASPDAHLPALPVYIELSGARGSVGIVLTKVRTLDPAVAATHPAS